MRRPPTPLPTPAPAARALFAACMIMAMGACADPSDHPASGGAGREADEPAASSPGGATVVAGAPVDDETLRRAVAITRAVDAGRVEVVTSITGVDARPDASGGDDARPDASGGDAVRVVHRAAFDRDRRRAEAETDMSQLAATLPPGGEPSPGDFSAPNRMVIDGDVVYSQVGPMAGAYGLAPTDWVRIDRSAFVDQRIDSDTAALLLDPLGPLDVLDQAASHVRIVDEGDERDVVRGAPVTHLAATLDPGAATAPDAPTWAGGTEGLPIDVWIDADGRVRRLELRLDAPARRGVGAGRATTTFELFDVGEPVDISPPGPADVLGTPGAGAPPR